jgi:hypothetical protein
MIRTEAIGYLAGLYDYQYCGGIMSIYSLYNI